MSHPARLAPSQIGARRRPGMLTGTRVSGRRRARWGGRRRWWALGRSRLHRPARRWRIGRCCRRAGWPAVPASWAGTPGPKKERACRQRQALLQLKDVARPERFELPTTWFVARYSIQLSYGRSEDAEFCGFPPSLSTRPPALSGRLCARRPTRIIAAGRRSPGCGGERSSPCPGSTRSPSPPSRWSRY